MFEFLGTIFDFLKTAFGNYSKSPTNIPQIIPILPTVLPIVPSQTITARILEKPSVKTPIQSKPIIQISSKPLVYFKDVIEKYGAPYDIKTQKQDDSIKLQWEHEWMELWKSEKFSEKTGINWPATAPFKRMYVNKDIIPYLDNAFIKLIEKDLFKELKTFDGCWNIRPIRGTTDKWSMHTFALAVDFNSKENPLGGPIEFSEEFLQCWRDTGWTCGADFKNVDGMHLQLPERC